MKLVVNHIDKSFQGNHVLKDFSLTLTNHEIAVVQGPSGVGKTTLLRCLNRLESIDAGEIILNDTVLQNGQGHKTSVSAQHAIGYVFQNYQLFPHMTVKENLIEAPVYHKLINKAQALSKAQQLLAQLGILDKMNAYPCTLSGGQQQRVAIARACMLSPEVLCFDEPTAALDPMMVQEVTKLIQKLANQGMGILIVSHDELFSQHIATKIIPMK